MSLKKKCEVVIYESDKKEPEGTIYLQNGKLGLSYGQFNEAINRSLIKTINYQHIYILSNDESVNKGDYIYDIQKRIGCCIGTKDGQYLISYTDETYTMYASEFKKIIASNNIRLKLPKPSTSFVVKYISEYNKGNAIKEIEVDYTVNQELVYNHAGTRKILEDSTPILKVDKNNIISISKSRNSWSKEEVIELIKSFNKTYDVIHEDHLNDWIEKSL